MPQIEDRHSALRGCTVFSILDIKQAYHCSVDVLRYGHAQEESVESVVSRITVFYC